jgi:hypothetical protein
MFARFTPRAVLCILAASTFPTLRAEGPAHSKDRTGRLITRTYSVADLVTPLPTDANGKESVLCKQSELPQQLILRITNAIEPDSWAALSGKGTIDYFPLGMTLVVNQTAEVHEQVARLLAKMRKDRNRDELKKLLADYEEACSKGNGDRARKLATQAMAIDPTCFSQKRSQKQAIEKSCYLSLFHSATVDCVEMLKGTRWYPAGQMWATFVETDLDRNKNCPGWFAPGFFR